MARPLRIQFPGALYHLTSRGNARERIFLDDPDRSAFVELLGAVTRRYRWGCYAYCLMLNHYHILIETPAANLAAGMRHLNGTYTQRFNRRHRRVGHVFQGRYHAVLVEKDSHLAELCRYIVLNPVRANVCRDPAEYHWTSYAATAGMVPAPPWLRADWLLARFARRRADAQRAYVRFVSEGRWTSSPWAALDAQVLLGSARFVDTMRRRMRPRALSREIPSVQRHVGRPALHTLFGERRAPLEKATRDRLIREAHLEHGYSLIAIAMQVGLHYTTISKIVNRACSPSLGGSAGGDER